MSCHEVDAMLSGYIDGELRDNDTEFVRSHVGACDDCAKKLNHLRRVSMMAASIPDVDPPAFLMDKILAKTVRRESFAQKLAAVLRMNRIPSLAGAASALILIAAAMWIYAPHAADTSSTSGAVSPGIAQPDAAASTGLIRPSATAANIMNAPRNINPANNMSNMRAFRANSKHYAHGVRKTSVGSGDVVASRKGTKAGRKADPRTAPSIDDRDSVETASIRKPNADNVVSDAPMIEKSDAKTEVASKVDAASDAKPADQGIRTAKALAEERDNRLMQETDALKEMRDKLRSRNLNRGYSSYRAQDMDEKTISLHIASVRF